MCVSGTGFAGYGHVSALEVGLYDVVLKNNLHFKKGFL